MPTMLAPLLNPQILMVMLTPLNGQEQLFQSIISENDPLMPNPIIMVMVMDIMDIPDTDIMAMVLLLMLDVLSGELENKLLLYLQLNKKKASIIFCKKRNTKKKKK